MIELKYEKYSIINKKYPTQTFDCSDCDMKYCFKDNIGEKCNNFEYIFKKNNYTWYHALKWSCETMVEYIEGKEWILGDGYTQYNEIILKLAKVIPNDLPKIASNILKFNGIPDLYTELPPNHAIEVIRWISDYAYDYKLLNYEEVGQGKEPKFSEPRLLSFEEQQERCKNYVHFDFSIKKPKFEKIDWNNIFRK